LALGALVSIFPPRVGSDDAVRAGGADTPSLSGARVRLREGVTPEEAAGGGAADTSAASWSDQGLEEQAGLTAAGGTTVHLHGRFRSAAVLTRDASGATSTDCIAGPPVQGDPD
jgi:hypothetical protein